VLTINKTDFDDFVCRGGDERFLSNGKIQTKSDLLLNGFFKEVILLRLVMINWLGMIWQMKSAKNSNRKL